MFTKYLVLVDTSKMIKKITAKFIKKNSQINHKY